MSDISNFEDAPPEGVDEYGQYLPTSGYPPAVAPNPNLKPIYEAMAERLRTMKSGLTGKQQIGALLVGMGQPTRSGRWQDMVGNAATSLSKYSTSARETDVARRDKLEALLFRGELEGEKFRAQREAAGLTTAARGAAKAAGGGLNADERLRLAFARRAFPNVSDAQLIASNALVSDEVNSLMVRSPAAVAAASRGEDAGAAVKAAQGAFTVPSLRNFMVRARGANPNATDAELIAYWTQEYGGK